jgi:hypothetical protein
MYLSRVTYFLKCFVVEQKLASEGLEGGGWTGVTVIKTFIFCHCSGDKK